jgi:hypothetical protein
MTETSSRWRDTSLSAAERVDALIGEMTLREKAAQLYGIWVASSPVGDDVAPFQHDMRAGRTRSARPPSWHPRSSPRSSQGKRAARRSPAC